VGKDAMAIELAKIVNCVNEKDEACDVCESCRRVNSLQHPDVFLVFALPVGKGEKSGDPPLAKLSAEEVEAVHEQLRLKASNRYHDILVPRATTIKVNSIRELRRQASLSTFHGRKKIMIIMEAADLNDEASNALLKTLEEPTEDTMIILTTSKRGVLLPTITSRCQDVRFDFLNEVEIASHLMARHQLDEANAGLIARLAHGSVARATGLLNVDLQRQREFAVGFLRKTAMNDPAEISQFIDELVKAYDRIEIEQLLLLMEFWLRDAFCVSEGRATIANIDSEESIRRFAQRYPSLDYGKLQGALERSISLLNKNVYIPLVLLTLSLTIRRLMLSAKKHEAPSHELKK
jgi:DNA polymerase-3 subunit delta'